MIEEEPDYYEVVPETLWRAGPDGPEPNGFHRRFLALRERSVGLCPNLRGVTLERMEGTVEQRDVALLREELRRVRRIVGA